MKNIYNLIFIITVVMFAAPLNASDLEVGKIYRLSVTLDLKSAIDSDKLDYKALKNSKYEILQEPENANYYIIRFNKIYESSDERYKDTIWVLGDGVYILPKNVGKISVATISTESVTGLTSGPLVVPFKYRLNNKSITGDATLGAYAGITFEPGCTKSNWCFKFTPLISAGLSQITVDNNGTQEQKTGATLAIGFLITNWSNINIGLLYGQDRIGDATWVHEGETWVSFMIGWELQE